MPAKAFNRVAGGQIIAHVIVRRNQSIASTRRAAITDHSISFLGAAEARHRWSKSGMAEFIYEVVSEIPRGAEVRRRSCENTSRASRASNLSLIYSLFLVNFCL